MKRVDNIDIMLWPIFFQDNRRQIYTLTPFGMQAQCRVTAKTVERFIPLVFVCFSRKVYQ